MKKEKITLTTKNIGEVFNKPVEEMTKKSAKKLSHKIDVYIKAQLKDKPKWFPFSQKKWERLACRFIRLDQLKK